MRKSLILILSILTAFLAVSSVPNVSASDNPIVRIYDSTFTTETDYFPTCPVTVGIKTYSAVGPYDVTLERKVAPDTWVLVTTLGTGMSAGQWHPFTYTCTQTGWWRAKAGSATIEYSVGSFFVIPEVPLGVATALTLCFTGLGITRLRRTRKESY